MGSFLGVYGVPEMKAILRSVYLMRSLTATGVITTSTNMQARRTHLPMIQTKGSFKTAFLVSANLYLLGCKAHAEPGRGSGKRVALPNTKTLCWRSFRPLLPPSTSIKGTLF